MLVAADSYTELADSDCPGDDVELDLNYDLATCQLACRSEVN